MARWAALCGICQDLAAEAYLRGRLFLARAGAAKDQVKAWLVARASLVEFLFELALVLTIASLLLGIPKP